MSNMAKKVIQKTKKYDIMLSSIKSVRGTAPVTTQQPATKQGAKG